MTTEKDVYDIDATGAVKSLNDVAKEQGKVAEGGDSLSKLFKEDMREALFTSQAAYDALKTSLSQVFEFLKDSTVAALEAIKADQQLTVALKNAGVSSGLWVEAIGRQAEALERLTGVDDEYYKQLATLLTTFGVAPEQINRFTKASLDLAAATGQDATTSARLLARAHAEGKDELTKYGIEVSDAEFKLKGFDAVLEKVEANFQGLHEQLPEQVKQLNKVKGAWESLKEAIGDTTLNLTTFEVFGYSLADSLDGWTEILTHKSTKATAEHGEKVAKASELYESYAAQVDEAKARQREYNEAVRTGAFNTDQLRERLEQSKEIVKQTAKEANALGTGLNLDETPLTKKIQLQPIALKGGAEYAAELRKREAEWKRHKEEMEKLALLSAANLKKLDDQEMAQLRAKLDAMGSLEEAWANEYRAQKAAEYEAEHSAAEQAEQERQAHADQMYQINRDAAAAEVAAVIAEQDKQLEMQRQLYAELGNIAKQGLDFVANLIAQQLTVNQDYNDAYQEALIQRRLYDQDQHLEELRLAAEREDATEQDKQLLKEATEAKKTAADMERELGEEAKAAQEKQTAAFLAGIAKEAGVKAVLEGAEALASLAKYDYAAAAQHGIAAAAFAGVATAAGGAAIALSANRGFTAEEKASIESLNRRERDRSSRANESSETSVSTTQNVYFFGISGMSDIQQTARLEELRRRFNTLNTGSGS